MDEISHGTSQEPPPQPGSEQDAAPGNAEDSEAGSATSSTRWWVPVGIIGGVGVLLFLVASQIYLVSSVDDTQDALAATRTELEETRGEVAQLENRVSDVGTSVDELSADIQSTTTQEPSSSVVAPAPVAPAGFLPRFVAGQQDSALGLKLGPISGPDAYTGVDVMIDPADGTKRVWMVWAHWCPYCQEELPSLAAAYEDLAITFPGIDIATVTSSIDPSRGNPLESYLEQQQFPFPVIVDVDLSLAGQMGVGAYPFWVITDGDGTVLFRSAGLLEHTQLVSLMTSLSEYEA